jgi:hypothetical protein
MLEKYPSLERDQREFFDLNQKIFDKIMSSAYENPNIRAEDKKKSCDARIKGFRHRCKDPAVKNMSDQDIVRTEAFQEETREELFDLFLSLGNKGPKGDVHLVKPIEATNLPGPAMSFKKALSTPYNEKETMPPRNGKTKGGEKHYIDELLDQKLKYLPPNIIFKGKRLNLGDNEERYVEPGDMVTVKYLLKFYDALGYGVRATFTAVNIVRKVKANESKDNYADYSMFDDEGEEESADSKVHVKSEVNEPDAHDDAVDVKRDTTDKHAGKSENFEPNVRVDAPVKENENEPSVLDESFVRSPQHTNDDDIIFAPQDPDESEEVYDEESGNRSTGKRSNKYKTGNAHKKYKK